MMNRLFYWGGHKNVGDELSLYLMRRIANREFEIASPPFVEITISAIGSLLSSSTLSKNLVVWGTGTLTERSLDPRPLKFFPVSRLVKDLGRRFIRQQPDIRAVRGPKTRMLLERKGINCSRVYGDPAILTPFFYEPKPLSDRFKIGLILHHIQSNLLKADELKDLKILLISVERETEEEIEHFVDEIVSCDYVYSSSLHGIILAQSYGIPAQWIQVVGYPIQKDSRHKFEDYFLGGGQIIQNPLKITLDIESLALLTKLSAPPRLLPFQCRDSLLDVFPFDVLS